MGFLHGKRALIVGIANQRSIAWGIANAMHREGAQLAFTFQDERLKDRVDEAAHAFGSNIVLSCDLAQDSQMVLLFARLGDHWDRFDILVHSIGYTSGEAPEGEVLDHLTHERLAITHEVASCSLAALAKAARPMMRDRGGAILTLSHPGAERAMDGHNAMGQAKAGLEASVRHLAQDLGPEGTRVNAISAGPIRTLAAAGMTHVRHMLDHVETHAPLRRSITIDEVGNVGAFLCSDLASGVTGEVIHVDAGYRILGATAP